jgi:hypothetical protein
MARSIISRSIRARDHWQTEAGVARLCWKSYGLGAFVLPVPPAWLASVL